MDHLIQIPSVGTMDGTMRLSLSHERFSQETAVTHGPFDLTIQEWTYQELCYNLAKRDKLMGRQPASRPMAEYSQDRFNKEFPELASKYLELLEAQRSVKGLDAKTRQLINIGI